MERSSRHWLALGLGTAVCLALAPAASAHPGHSGSDQSLLAGALHPLTGPDHLLAMLASGLLAVRIGTRQALGIVPLSFVGLMLIGGALAALGLPLPHAEWGISLSVIVLGAAVAMLPSIPLGAGAALVGLFALFHGHAHVAELGGQALLPYMLGFVLATLILHMTAIGGGLLATRAGRPFAIRVAGAAITALFAVMLVTG